MNYSLILSYVGTGYCGWQVQPNGITVQETLQNAIEKVFGKRYPVIGCSRTDAGVHANGFLCCVKTDEEANTVPLDRIPAALNSNLPLDISVLCASAADDDFHPRYDTYGKEYRYLFYDRRIRDPFLLDRVWHIGHRLDESLMARAAAEFCGKHDFSAFCSVGAVDDDHVRTIYSSKVERKADTVVFTVSGDGFLYNMVRIMAGTLCEIGGKRRDISTVDNALRYGKREQAGITAPACGLYLQRVFTEPFII